MSYDPEAEVARLEEKLDAVERDRDERIKALEGEEITLRGAIEAIVESSGFKRYHSKGDGQSMEWHSPKGKFCLLEDIPKENKAQLDQAHAVLKLALGALESVRRGVYNPKLDAATITQYLEDRDSMCDRAIEAIKACGVNCE